VFNPVSRLWSGVCTVEQGQSKSVGIGMYKCLHAVFSMEVVTTGVTTACPQFRQGRATVAGELTSLDFPKEQGGTYAKYESVRETHSSGIAMSCVGISML